VAPYLAEENAMAPSTEWFSRRPDTSPGDPTAVARQQRQQTHMANVRREAVIEALCQLVRDTMFEECNALTVSVRDALEHPPEDRWSLDQGVKGLPYRLRAEIGTAWVRLVGEAWLFVAEA
jgi:hypothetical protein